MEEATPVRIRQLTGVYRFDATARHLAARMLGDGCGLRALTHRGLRANPEWSAMAGELIVPVVLTDLDRAPEPIHTLALTSRPCVLATTRGGAVPLLGPADLDRIAGRVTLFLDEVRKAARAAGLIWTMPMWDSSPAPLYAVRSADTRQSRAAASWSRA
ncbi:hypothetical protein DFJ67_5308 [Asanoa ferruginea]|uniref:Uncharacterized protein n=1 Tax=Asanoa ferruginea TaxID=53367 RepID=A0A3D9ZRM1_9ACTN|nr:hypothetical protein [Asanoa ferruginea]REF99274.1 hypothetical protein DFJ67_5308 [Asanoa ferruginea]GIF45873.1 hypothetical protein Afe04nite_04120 [Asanoa ferruginea]